MYNQNAVVRGTLDKNLIEPRPEISVHKAFTKFKKSVRWTINSFGSNRKNSYSHESAEL